MCLDFSKDELLQYNIWKLYIYHLIKRLIQTLTKSNIKRIAIESFITNDKNKNSIILLKIHCIDYRTIIFFNRSYIENKCTKSAKSQVKLKKRQEKCKFHSTKAWLCKEK